MSEFQECAVTFHCKKSNLNKLLELCNDVGITVRDTDCMYTAENGSVMVEHIESGGYSSSLLDDLKELKDNLIKAGAKEVSVKHAWPSELIEVERKGEDKQKKEK